MRSLGIFVAVCISAYSISASHLPLPTFQGSLYNPYYQFFRYSSPLYNGFLNYPQPYNPYIPFNHHLEPNFFSSYFMRSYPSQPYVFPPFYILEEVPYSVRKDFTVVPMIVALGDSMKPIKGQITQISKSEPTMTVKNEIDQQLQCVPAVKVTLDKPMISTSLRSNILFPKVIEINNEGLKIPLEVGAVIVPVPKGTVVSEDSPVAIRVVYAISTTPLNVDYVNNNKDVVVDGDNQAVIVDRDPIGYLPPKNVTILDFPEKEAEPTLQVDEDDESLVNRNPPIGLVPAGIVQSTQPQASVQQFHNSKESPLLTQLREEAQKHRLKSTSF